MACSAFVLVPSLWEEPFGAVALEAVAARALVVASDRGGLAEATGDLGFCTIQTTPPRSGMPSMQLERPSTIN